MQTYYKGAREISPATREWLRRLMFELRVSQKALADYSGVRQSWLSQLLAGRRTHINPAMLVKLRQGLLRQLESYKGDDQAKLKQEVQLELGEDTELTTQEVLRAAADMFTVLQQRCPGRRMRQQVVEFLKVVVEQ